uniref:Uncharacterized protein n=1 Tax=viral metagenome TaxID=1070528 RepID=A0A6C0K9B0_9ZZZZ
MDVHRCLEKIEELRQNETDLRNKIKNIQKELRTQRLWLQTNCNHEWVYHRECPYDMPDYQCKHCRAFQSLPVRRDT